tara:strand:- start:22 stop:621 length:600 start_codon:yes stop_codon:yes gene_type:complete
MSFEPIRQFEKEISDFFGSPYAVATDCCTHALELCLRYKEVKHYTLPRRTYISVPFLANKLGITFEWRDEDWQEYYYLGGTNIVDAAVLWRENSFIENTLMCVSFQYKKHLSLGRGGIILIDDEKTYKNLKRMSYDGRYPIDTPWAEQDIDIVGYHYYMTPETAQKGLDKLADAIASEPKKWTIEDWPDLTKMSVFQNV